MQILTVLVAFVSIVLLLAIVVTALVQFTQAALRLRGRNLVNGLAALFHAAQTGVRAGKAGAEHRDQARAALNTLEAGNLSPDTTPLQKTLTRLLGPRVSYIDTERLLNASRAANIAVDTGAIRALCPVAAAAMDKRFALHMRVCSFAWGIAIAVLFQISAPRLIHELWLDPARAAAIADRADGYIKGADEVIQGFHDFEDAAADALPKLAERYPASRERIEQASGVGVNREYIVAELRLALRDDPDRDRILADYEDMLGDWKREYVDALARDVGYASGELRSLGLVPMREDGFFFDRGVRWSNVYGVLMTALLLMLGAPFWFNVLRNLSGLRDALKGKSKES